MKILAFAVVLILCFPDFARSEESWAFIVVRESTVSAPKWEPREGRARVGISGEHLSIKAYYNGNTEGGTDHELAGDPDLLIEGTLRPDRAITATCVFPGTDAKPLRLNGKYYSREDTQTWGVKLKKIVYKEIVFPFPQNLFFLGLISREVSDR